MIFQLHFGSAIKKTCFWPFPTVFKCCLHHTLHGTEHLSSIVNPWSINPDNYIGVLISKNSEKFATKIGPPLLINSWLKPGFTWVANDLISPDFPAASCHVMPHQVPHLRCTTRRGTAEPQRCTADRVAPWPPLIQGAVNWIPSGNLT
jgi:hypothetical protein